MFSHLLIIFLFSPVADLSSVIDAKSRVGFR